MSGEHFIKITYLSRHDNRVTPPKAVYVKSVGRDGGYGLTYTPEQARTFATAQKAQEVAETIEKKVQVLYGKPYPVVSVTVQNGGAL